MANAVVLRGGGGGVDCENATATATNVLQGYTFGTSTSDELLTGSMTNRGAVSQTITSPVGGTYTITQGYHNGSGTVSGKKMTEQAAYTITPSTTNQTITSGKYYTGNVTIKADSNFVASNIRQNVKIFSITGTAPDYAASQRTWTS